MRDELRLSEEVRSGDWNSIGARWGLVSNMPKPVFELNTCNEMLHHEKVSFSENESFRLLVCTRYQLAMRKKIPRAVYRFDVVAIFSTGSKQLVSMMTPSGVLLSGHGWPPATTGAPLINSSCVPAHHVWRRPHRPPWKVGHGTWFMGVSTLELSFGLGSPFLAPQLVLCGSRAQGCRSEGSNSPSSPGAQVHIAHGPANQTARGTKESRTPPRMLTKNDTQGPKQAALCQAPPLHLSQSLFLFV